MEISPGGGIRTQRLALHTEHVSGICLTSAFPIRPQRRTERHENRTAWRQARVPESQNRTTVQWIGGRCCWDERRASAMENARRISKGSSTVGIAYEFRSRSLASRFWPFGRKLRTGQRCGGRILLASPVAQIHTNSIHFVSSSLTIFEVGM